MKVGDLVMLPTRKVDIIVRVLSNRHVQLSSFPDNQVFNVKDLEVVNESR